MKEIEGVNVICGDGKPLFIPDALIPAMAEFVEQFRVAVTLGYVRKPVAFAMYKAWQEVDRREKARKNNE